MIHAFFGYDVHVTPYPPMIRTQYRYPKSKRKRIRKKWAKQSKNFKEDPTTFRIGNKLIMGPRTYAKMCALVPATIRGGSNETVQEPGLFRGEAGGARLLFFPRGERDEPITGGFVSGGGWA